MIEIRYSFLNLSGSISHPVFGSFPFMGEEIGEAIITMPVARTAHDNAADGSIMISKIAGNNGTLRIRCQHTPDMHKWLLKWSNYLKSAPTSEYAQTIVLLRNTKDGTSHKLSGVTPYGQVEQEWVLMAADIQPG